jgi:hypothetical protein
MKRLLLLLGCSGALLCGADLTGVHTVYVMPMARGLDQYLANRISNQGVFRVVTDPKLADAVITDLIGEVFQTQLETFSPTPKAADAAPAAAPETKTPAAAEKAAKPATPAAGDKAAKPAEAVAKPAEPAAKPGESAAKTDEPAAKPAEPAKAPQPLVAKADTDPVLEKVTKPAKSRNGDTGSVVSMFTDTENKVATPISTFGRGKGTIFLVDAKSRQIVWSTFDPSKGNRNHDLDRTASDIVSRLKKDLKQKKQQ